MKFVNSLAYEFVFEVEVPELLKLSVLLGQLRNDFRQIEAQPVVVAVGGYTLLEVRAHDGDLHSTCLGQLVGLLEETFLSLIEAVLVKVEGCRGVGDSYGSSFVVLYIFFLL